MLVFLSGDPASAVADNTDPTGRSQGGGLKQKAKMVAESAEEKAARQQMRVAEQKRADATRRRAEEGDGAPQALTHNDTRGCTLPHFLNCVRRKTELGAAAAGMPQRCHCS